MGVISPILWLDELRHGWNKGCGGDHTLHLQPGQGWLQRFQRLLSTFWVLFSSPSWLSQGTNTTSPYPHWEPKLLMDTAKISMPRLYQELDLPPLQIFSFAHKTIGLGSMILHIPRTQPHRLFSVSHFTDRFWGSLKATKRDPGSAHIPG